MLIILKVYQIEERPREHIFSSWEGKVTRILSARLRNIYLWLCNGSHIHSLCPQIFLLTYLFS